MTDEELLLAFKTSGSNAWLGYLLQRYTLLLLGVGMKYLKDRAAAEDAVQQVFLKALAHFPHEDVHNIKGWLYILMRNYCLQVLRSSKHFASTDLPADIAEENETEEPQWKDYTPGQLSMAINELNSEQQQCISLFYLQKQTYEQIMQATGFTFMQVKSYIQNGKRNLKTILIKKIAGRQL